MKRARKPVVRDSSAHAPDRIADGENGRYVDSGSEGEPPVQMSEQMEEQAWRAPRGGIPGLSPEREAEIRQRIASDLYHSRAVAEVVARRILAEGEL